MADSMGEFHVLSGYCPDEVCQTQLFFRRSDSSVECSNCGQRHQQKALNNISEATNKNIALEKILLRLMFGNKKPQKGPESVKVLGFSNYECKILSPLFTLYGMEKNTGKAQLLLEMGRREIFDCGMLSDYAFLIDPDQMEVSGYGRDHSGSLGYLDGTLKAVRKSNNNEETLLPIHADGDGHCLVHAVSRAITGRELFWHALRANLKEHFQENIDRYKMQFSDFVDSNEWSEIIEECDPDFEPRDGEPMGLRNIHIFGLANILRRPIILLDSITGMQSSADYTGVFLPGMVLPEMCHGKDGQLNKPLCLAWSSSGHNHYIALVGIKGRPLPRIPSWMVPKAWGIAQSQLSQYLNLDEDGGCVIGGMKCLGDSYILRLMRAMETKFKEQNGVSVSLVADYKQYIYQFSGLVLVQPSLVVRETARAVKEQRLYRCFVCHALTVHTFLPEWFLSRGRLYRQAVSTHGRLKASVCYTFKTEGIAYTYDEEKDCLVPDFSQCRLPSCTLCSKNILRLVRGDGSIVYMNGDLTETPTIISRCKCGYKHFWDGKEYDNMPLVIPVQLEWGGKMIRVKVVWFQNESDPALNSNVFEMAQKLLQEHFPGEFGSEVLVQKVVNQILEQTAALTALQEDGVTVAINHMQTPGDAVGNTAGDTTGDTASDTEPQHADRGAWDKMSASKIILTGNAKQTLHKEELTKSGKEREVRRQIELNGNQLQRRRTLKDSQQPPTMQSPTKVNPKQQKTAANGIEEQSGKSYDPDKKSGLSTSNGSVEKTDKSMRQIRVSTSDGQQMQVALAAGTTYRGLQELLADLLKVPPARQRIKVGFPPCELLPPLDSEPHDAVLQLKHGVRIMLEIKPDPDTPPDNTDESLPVRTGATDKSLPTNPKLEDELASLTRLAGLNGADLWRHVQAMPEMFGPGGAFYEQVKRDHLLIPDKHCRLSGLPDKIFRYNATEDILELCLEPYGHFRVEPGVEEHARDDLRPTELVADFLTSSLGFPGIGPQLGTGPTNPAALQEVLKSSSQRVTVDPKMKQPVMPQGAFFGRGHSLSGREQPMLARGQPMLGRDLFMFGRGFSMLGRGRAFSASAEPLVGLSQSLPSPEDQHLGLPMETNEQLGAGSMQPMKTEERLFRRVGPGSRVLQPQVQNDASVSISKLIPQFDDAVAACGMHNAETSASSSGESEKMDMDNPLSPPLGDSVAKGDESTETPPH